VGETKNMLMERFKSHFWHIKTPKTEFPLGFHFSQKDHNKLADVRIHVLDYINKNPQNSLELRLHTEKMWIHRLRTPEPLGLNTMD